MSYIIQRFKVLRLFKLFPERGWILKDLWWILTGRC